MKPATLERRISGSFLTTLKAAAATLALAVQASCLVGAREGGGSGEPVWLAPAPGSGALPQPAVLRWAPVPEADGYRLRIGSTQGADDLLNVKGIPATATSHRVPAELPALKPLYARISAHRDGVWRHAEARFSADRVAAEWLYPTPGSALVEPGHAFEWTAVRRAREYRVTIGTAPFLADVLDRTVSGRTQLEVGELPLGRRLIARVSTRVEGEWYTRDSDFALRLGYRAAPLVHPLPGNSADARRPFEWQPVPLASGYRLRIGPRRGSASLYDSGVVSTSRTFVPALPAGRTLFATLTTAYADRSIEHPFEFRTTAGTPDESRIVEAALATTVEVRAMAGFRGAWPRTLLDAVVKRQQVTGPGCVELAMALIEALQQQRNPLPARFLNTCLLGNRYDCHTLVELQLPRSDRWMLLDPTFAVTARRRSGEWATASDVSDAVRREDWAGIRFVPLAENSLSLLRAYYIDYPLLFVSPFGQEPPHPDGGPAILRYYEEVPLPVRQGGGYAIRCQGGSEATVVIDGRPTEFRCQGRDGLSEIRSAPSIAKLDSAIQVYRPRRFVFQ